LGACQLSAGELASIGTCRG